MVSVSFLVLVLLAGIATSELRGLSPRVAPPKPEVRSTHLALCPSP